MHAENEPIDNFDLARYDRANWIQNKRRHIYKIKSKFAHKSQAR